MKQRIALLVLAASIIGLGPAAHAAPDNDNFADAATIADGGTVSTSTVDATDEFLEPSNCNGGASVWYVFEPVEDGDVAVTTAGSDFDTSLSVYVGSANPPIWDLDLVACNDDAGDLTSALTFDGRTGSTYYIQAGGWLGQQGSLTLSVFRPGGIAGEVVTNIEDRPAWACVAAHESSSGQIVGSAWSDYDGSYLIAPLPAGSYKVRFSTCGGPSFPTQWYDDKPSFDDADAVVVVAGSTTPDIDASVTLATQPESPIDVAVTGLEIENVPLKTDAGELPGTGTVRDVTVTVTNVGEADALGWVDVGACPATGAFCQHAGGTEVGLAPGESRTVTIRWNALGGFGDYSVEAYAGFSAADDWEVWDRNWLNNSMVREHYVILGGTGFGV